MHPASNLRIPCALLESLLSRTHTFRGILYRHLRNRLAEAVIPFVLRTYNIGVGVFAVDQPPKIQFGEYALPLAFELGKKLRRPPRKVAEEIVAGVGVVE